MKKNEQNIKFRVSRLAIHAYRIANRHRYYCDSGEHVATCTECGERKGAVDFLHQKSELHRKSRYDVPQRQPGYFSPVSQ